MTAIYCAKCRESTSTKSEKKETTEKGRYRLIGICAICGTKKGMFVNSNWKVNPKTREEREEAKEKREKYAENRRVKKLAKKIKDNDAEECVKLCLASYMKHNK
jgi:site-specific DNA-adenine methylase